MATTDEPQNIKIGGAGIMKLFFIPLVVFIFFLSITYFFPNLIPPGNLVVVPEIDPATGQPLNLEPMVSLIASLINSAAYGSITSLIVVVYLIKKRAKQRSLGHLA